MRQPTFKLNPKLLGLIVALLGLVVLLGWYTHNIVLIQVQSSFAPMQYNTALGFLFSGLGLFFAAGNKPKLSALLGFLLILIGSLTLIQYIATIDLHIDQLFMKHYVTTQSAAPGRMAPNTALCFLLTGVTLFVLNTLPQLEIFKLLGAVITGLGVIAIIGYLTGIETAYGWGHLTRMAIHTSSGFIVLGIGITLWGIPTSSGSGLVGEYWWPTTLSITLTVVVLLLWQALNGWHDNSIRSKVNDQLISFKHMLEQHLQTQQHALERMAKRWEAQHGTSQAHWEADTKNYLDDLDDVNAMAWFDSELNPRWATSKTAYKNSGITRFSRIPEVYDSLTKAQENQLPSISNVLTVDQGKPFFIISVPLRKNHKFDGLLVAFFQIDQMFTHLFSATKLWENFSLQLYENDKLVFGEQKKNNAEARFKAEDNITIADKPWKIALYPKTSKIKELSSFLPETVLVTGILSSSLLISLYLLRRREQEKSRQLRREIKQHNQTRSKLLYEEHRLLSTLETMADAVILIDIDEKILSFNQAATTIFGYSANEVINQSVRGLIPSSSNPQTEAYRNYFLQGGKPKNIDEDMDLMAVRKNGESFPISLAISSMEINGQHFFSAVIRDISEQKKHQAMLQRYTQELERSNQELSDFAYVASHDLKAPLRGIMQLSNWITEDLKGKVDEQITEYLELIQNRTARLEKLLDDLLAYSRAGRKHGDFSEINVTQLAQDIFQLLNPSSTFSLECAEDLPCLVTLTVPFELILRNLINNAIKHHHSNSGVIKITAQATDEGYQFNITDDGPGIEPQFHQQVFGLFQTLKPRDEVEASGMGLAIVKKLIDTYHSKIFIESDGVAGTCISFTWPNEATLRRLIND